MLVAMVDALGGIAGGQYRSNIHVHYASNVMHEVMWLGMLGRVDDQRAKPGTLPSNTAVQTQMTLTAAECSQIRDRLKVR